MSRRSLVAIAVLGISLAASAAAHQGIFEYWKAGARRGRSKSSLPAPSSRTRTADLPARASSDRPAPPWTEAWFSDSTLIRGHLATMTASLTVPMIGQGFPLPRGGGFVCSRIEGDDNPADGGLTCVIQCVGPELGGRRRNYFYVSKSDPAPTLDRVRWSFLAPRGTLHAPWRRLFLVLADSLSGEWGRPTWSGQDSMEATWRGDEYTTTMRFHGASTRVDSLDVECVSGRLAAGDPRTQSP